MSLTLATHRYDPLECADRDQHRHEYRPREPAVMRCRCNSTKFLVVLGRSGEVRVICARCEQVNRTATCYELGRTDGRHGR